MCITKDNNTNIAIYGVKVVNESGIRLVDVDYNLYYCTGGKDDVVYKYPVTTSKHSISTLAPYSDNNTDYAVRITYEIDEQKYPMNSNSYFEFIIQATHPRTNGRTFKILEFHQNDLMVGYVFETGESTKVVSARVPITP